MSKVAPAEPIGALRAAQIRSLMQKRLPPFLPGRIGLARRCPLRTGRVRLAGWSPARLAASVLLLSRTAGPPQLVRPLPVALARLPALDRLMPTDCMGGREPLQCAAVAQRFLRRNLKRDRRQAT